MPKIAPYVGECNIEMSNWHDDDSIVDLWTWFLVALLSLRERARLLPGLPPVDCDLQQWTITTAQPIDVGFVGWFIVFCDIIQLSGHKLVYVQDRSNRIVTNNLNELASHASTSPLHLHSDRHASFGLDTTSIWLRLWQQFRHSAKCIVRLCHSWRRFVFSETSHITTF
jgi:hypothetical protein